MDDNKLNILIIEDDDVDRMLIESSLKTAKIADNICFKPDLTSGQEQLNSQSYHALILDNNLPDGLGIEFLKKIRDSGADIPVILITGHGDELMAVKAIKTGASDYIPKDRISPESISRSILNSIDSYKLIMRAKQAELTLAEREQRYRMIVETVSDLIFELDQERKIIFSNSAFEMLGYSSDELLNQPITDFIVCENMEQTIEQIATRDVGPLATTNLIIEFKVNPESAISDAFETMEVHLDAFGLWDVSAELAFKKNIEKKFLGTVCIGHSTPK